MTPVGRSLPPLPIRASLAQGWGAFRRSPQVFMGFTLLAGGLQLLGQRVQNGAVDALEQGEEPITLWLIVAALGLALSLTSGLWLSVGLVRGGAMALEGRRPRFADLARWDGAALRRLLGVGLLLLLVLLVTLLLTGLAAGLASLVRPTLGLLLLLAGSGVVLFIAVAQLFHLPFTVLGELGPVAAFRLGQSVDAAAWWRQFALALLLAAILLLGALMLGLGLIIAVPWSVCSLAAAYRQSRDTGA